jgi:GntR family transcriptional regulator
MQSAIAAGVYREGEAVPSARALSLQLKVNPNTVQKAFDELDALGVIETRRGLGKFVTPGAGKSAELNRREQIELAFKDGIRKAFDTGMRATQIEQLFRSAMREIKDNESIPLKGRKS